MRQARQITGLISAALSERPAHIGKGRPRGTARQGLQFEAQVARQLARYGAKHGQWFEFWDVNGRGYCQPDIIIVRPGFVLLFECKRTIVDSADDQLLKLYVPILQHVYKVPVLSFVVVKNLTRDCDQTRVVDSLSAALKLALEAGLIPVLHWLGQADGTFTCSVL